MGGRVVVISYLFNVSYVLEDSEAVLRSRSRSGDSVACWLHDANAGSAARPVHPAADVGSVCFGCEFARNKRAGRGLLASHPPQLFARAGPSPLFVYIYS